MSIWIFTDRLRTPFTTQTTHSNLLLHLVTVLASLSSLGSPNESTRSWNLPLLNSIPITSLQRLFEGLLKTEFIFLTEMPLRETTFPRLLHFILSVLRDSVTAVREWDRHVNVMKQWRLCCRLVWEWAERWGYVFSAAATVDSMIITAVNTIARRMPHAISEWRILSVISRLNWTYSLPYQSVMIIWCWGSHAQMCSPSLWCVLKLHIAAFQCVNNIALYEFAL